MAESKKVYDSQEARWILVRDSNRMNPEAFNEARGHAAAALMNQFIDLVRETNACDALYIGPEYGKFMGDAWAIGLPHRKGIVMKFQRGRGTIAFFRENEGTGAYEMFDELLLPVDPATGLLTTFEIDTTVAPRPGEPLPRRSALAVLSERVMRFVGRENSIPQ